MQLIMSRASVVTCTIKRACAITHQPNLHKAGNIMVIKDYVLNNSEYNC